MYVLWRINHRIYDCSVSLFYGRRENSMNQQDKREARLCTYTFCGRTNKENRLYFTEVVDVPTSKYFALHSAETEEFKVGRICIAGRGGG